MTHVSHKKHTAKIHWIAQRLSGLIIWPLMLHVGYNLYPFLQESQQDLQYRVSSLEVCIPIAILSIMVIVHAGLGLHSVVIDYMPRPWHRSMTFILKTWVWFLSGVVLWSLGGIAFSHNEFLQGLLLS